MEVHVCNHRGYYSVMAICNGHMVVTFGQNKAKQSKEQASKQEANNKKVCVRTIWYGQPHENALGFTVETNMKTTSLTPDAGDTDANSTSVSVTFASTNLKASKNENFGVSGAPAEERPKFKMERRKSKPSELVAWQRVLEVRHPSHPIAKSSAAIPSLPITTHPSHPIPSLPRRARVHFEQ